MGYKVIDGIIMTNGGPERNSHTEALSLLLFSLSLRRSSPAIVNDLDSAIVCEPFTSTNFPVMTSAAEANILSIGADHILRYKGQPAIRIHARLVCQNGPSDW